MSDSISRAERRSYVASLEFEVAVGLMEGFDSTVSDSVYKSVRALKKLDGCSYFSEDVEENVGRLKGGNLEFWRECTKVASEYYMRGAGINKETVSLVSGIIDKAEEYIDVSEYRKGLLADRKIVSGR